ncbi:MAG: trypsin-like peptidase domain-containing protein [Sandaracinaceae bacterium]|jgi:S1-C subfamily serine protease|nr:trypsin-like peptidase domain-containing protein [Sandaracinaceae bacterium]
MQVLHRVCRVVLLCALFFATTAAVASAQESRAVALRPQDRGVVRLYAQRGFAATIGGGIDTGSQRMYPSLVGGHGTGFVVSRDGLVVTAHHVVANAFYWLAVMPGSTEPRAAIPVYVDEEHDIAILQVQGRFADVVDVPTREVALVAGQAISVAGYPRELAQREPAVTIGAVSRTTNDGKVEASMSVNPGDSGGPVRDDRGRLVGLLIERGDPDQGLQGIALFQPVRFVRAALDAYRRDHRLPLAADELTRRGLFAQSLVDMLGLGLVPGETPDAARARALGYTRHALAAVAHARSPEDRTLVAASCWHSAILLLERHRAVEVRNLSDAAMQRTATELIEHAIRLARSVTQDAPYFRWNLSFVENLLWQEGRVVAIPEPERVDPQSHAD